VLLGTAAMMHPDFAILRALAAGIAEAAGVRYGVVGTGANDVGAWMAGAVPHRDAGGAAVEAGKNAATMLAEGCDTWLTLGVEPEMDCANPAAASRALAKGKLIALSSYMTPWLQENADVILPVGLFAETSVSQVSQPSANIVAAWVRRDRPGRYYVYWVI